MLFRSGRVYQSAGLDDLLLLEELAAREFGEKLCAPAQALGEFENFAALRRDGAWPLLRDLTGKIIVIFHYSEDLTEQYAAQDPSLRTQKMFPALWHPNSGPVDRNYASFVLCNEPLEYADEIAAMAARGLLVRTRLDMHGYPYSEEAYTLGAGSGALLLSTDHPPREGEGYTAWLEGQYTMRIKPEFD